MAYAEHSYTRLPPDGFGKRIATVRNVRLSYVTGSEIPKLDDVITGGTSGTTGRCVAIDGASTSAAGVFYVLPDPASAVDSAPEYTLGEALTYTRAGGSPVGFATLGSVATTNTVEGSQSEYHTPEMILTSGDNPYNAAQVDNRGALVVRFPEGVQQLTAFGETRVAQPEQLAQYTFPYNVDEDPWQLVTVGGGTRSHVPDLSAVRLSVGTAAGDIARLTTDLYHPYQSGVGQLIEMTVFIDAASRTGRRARWGYFCENDGVFFEVEDDALYVVTRSSTSGSPVDTRTPVSGWNGDHLDGTGPGVLGNRSGMLLDMTKLNIYWLDFKWLGAGGPRFGVFSENNGERLVVHNDVQANKQSAPFLRQPNQPLRIEIENVSGPTSGASSITLVCGAVFMDGKVIPARSRRTKKYTRKPAAVACADATVTPIVSYRSTGTLGTIANRKVSIPELLAINVTTTACRLVLLKNANLTSPTWAQALTGSGDEVAVDEDTAATLGAGSDEIVSWVLAPGQHNLELPLNFGLLSERLTLRADGSAGDTYTFAAEGLGGIANVQVFPTWIDI